MYKLKSFYMVITLLIALFFLAGIVELKVENRLETISLTNK
jgi:hypothetical protein